jgi:DNA-binding CsgD family transcriptional regulator
VLALVHATAGDVDRGQAAIAPVLRLVEGVEGEAFVAGLARAMATLALRRGDAEAACEWLAREAATADRGEPTWAAAQAMAGLGAALALLARDGEAAGALDRAEAAARRRGMPSVLAEALAARAVLAARESDGHERAAELNHAALHTRVQHGLWASVPDSLESIASLGAASRPTVDDVRVLAAAAAARAAMGLPSMPHRAPAQRAAITVLRSALGDPAFEAAWQEGGALTLEKAAALARRARGTRGRPSSGWASLTPTELEVVNAVVDGLTNPEIGARLFMSRGTVKTHLSHIFAKLDVGNRTELATFAAGRPRRAPEVTR